MQGVETETLSVPDTSQVAAEVLGIAQKLLGPYLTAEQQLMEAGLDSLGAVELRTSLASAFRAGFACHADI